MRSASALYRLLGDEARLRLLRLLAKERLNVTELTKILGLAQSGVSRHLGLLKDAGLIAEERAGGFSYYRVAYESRLPSPRRGPGKPAPTKKGSSWLKPAPTGGAVGADASVVGSGFSRTDIDEQGTDTDEQRARGPIWALLEAQFAAAAHDRTARADDARLEEVLRLRKESFETHGDERGQLVPGRS